MAARQQRARPTSGRRWRRLRGTHWQSGWTRHTAARSPTTRSSGGHCAASLVLVCPSAQRLRPSLHQLCIVAPPDPVTGYAWAVSPVVALHDFPCTSARTRRRACIFVGPRKDPVAKAGAGPPGCLFRRHAARYEAEFLEDMDALNCRQPHALTRVSEYMGEIRAYVDRIHANGMAYARGGSVYFDTQAFRRVP